MSKLVFLWHGDREAIIETVKGLIECYDADRDGDDFWTKYVCPSGIGVDLNMKVAHEDGNDFVVTKAYPNYSDGTANRSTCITISKSQTANNNTTEEGSF